MKARFIVKTLALATLFAVDTSFGQVDSTAGLQQPASFAAPQPAGPVMLQQPSAFVNSQPITPVAPQVTQSPVATSTNPASIPTTLHQPAALVASRPAMPAATPAAPAVLHQPRPFANTQPAISAVLRQPAPVSPVAMEHPSPTAGLDAEERERLEDDEYDEDYDEEEEDEDEDDECEDEEDDMGSCRAQNFGWYSDGCCEGCYDYSCCDTENWYWGGWVQQGITFNGYDPADGFNGVVGLNDFANQWQMNQVWLYTEKCVDATSNNLEFGGNVDIVFGTDGEFMQMSDGLEESWGQNGDYQLALLQFYLDFGWNNWELIIGRWYSPLGYEGYEGTNSFFYSRAYSFMWGTSGTFLGAQLSYYMTDNFMLMGGIHRGADQFDDTDGKDTPGFVGGGSWWSDDECSWLDVYVMTDEDGPQTSSLAYSIMAGTRVACFDYMIEGNWGDDYNQGGGEWYGINQHLTRQLNTEWAAGGRVEWFRDDDGRLVTSFRDGNTANGPFIGNFVELTFALNYTPCSNFSLRPEVRWDWYQEDNPGGPLPFDDGNRDNQFLVSLDAIYVF